MRDEVKINAREIKDIYEQINTLAKSYTPEWKFTTQNPDIGSVIGIIFAKQFEESIKHYNMFLDKCHLEYMNMLGISQRPSEPAKLIAEFKPVAGSDSVYIPKGTALVAQTEDDEAMRVIFETDSPVCVTSARIKAVIMSDKEAMLEKLVYNGEGEFCDIVLGNFNDYTGIKKQFGIFHNSLFNLSGRELCLDIEGNIPFADYVNRGDYSIQYRGRDGIEDAVVRCDNRKLFLTFDKEFRNIDTKQDDSYLREVIITQEKYSDNDIVFDSILMESTGEACRADYVSNHQIEQNKDHFELFGDELGLYAECYIGMDNYFCQKGAKITVNFSVSIRERMVGQRPKAKEDLRIIKRKKYYEYNEVISDAYAENVIYEYLSEQGWKRLNIEQEQAGAIFNGEYKGNYEISFISPDDWIESAIEGYRGRCLRVQLIKSENCYIQPARHHLPVISNMRIEYSYENNPQLPVYYKVKDFYSEYGERWTGRSVQAFAKTYVPEDALYIALDKNPKSGTLSIYFKFANVSFEGMECRFEYFSKKGFKQMSVVDMTEGAQVSGLVTFLVPEDFVETQIAGVKGYYIRIVDVNQVIRNMQAEKPVIENIILNAAEALNLQTMDEMEFFVDNPSGYMEFGLGVNNIYDTQVWVNEIDKYSLAEIKSMLENNSESCRVEYDTTGNIKNFFVRWNEVLDFTLHKNERVYVLDRNKGIIKFGDGVNNPIPSKSGEVAFYVAIRVSNRLAGNVKAHSIDNVLARIGSIADVDNPYSAYGGTEIEPVSLAEFRGTHLMSSSNRLVTMRDYENAVFSFSDNIVRVKCIKADGKIIIVVLIKDCEEDINTFCVLKNQLKDMLLESGEMTLTAKNIEIREPLFVEISVQLWVSAAMQIDRFQLQEEVNQSLTKYLKPVTGNNNRGWDIGEIPKKTQIIMKLKFLERKISIKNCVISARYSDETGLHEVDADKLRNNPYVCIRNGIHEVHILDE